MLPNLVAGLDVDGIEAAVGPCDVQDPVMLQRLDFLAALLLPAKAECQGRRQLLEVVVVQRRPRAEPLPVPVQTVRQNVARVGGLVRQVSFCDLGMCHS
jgi:hypothetical protein